MNKLTENIISQENERLSDKLEVEKRLNQYYKTALITLDSYIRKLDEAMATPERIEEDTKAVGGFVSDLYLSETQETIIDKAIKIIEDCRKTHTPLENTEKR